MSARWCRYLAAALACLPGLAAAQAVGLKHDPFTRPLLAPPPAPAASAPAYTIKAPEPAWYPELRAIMVAGPDSMVDVGGALVRLGEHINGYRLVEVHDETAVFVNDKKRVTLSLRGLIPSRPPAQDEGASNERRDVPPKDERGTNERRDAPPSLDDRGVAQPRDDASKPEVK